MLKNRVIPILLLKDSGLVKTIKFKNPKYVGDPINAIKIFNEKEVDELIVLDIEVSRFNREINYNLIEEFASECFMPLCYGGGVNNISQAKRLFNLGVEKIAIKTGAFENQNLIYQIASEFGSQSMVASIDIKKNWFGKYELYDHTNMRVIKKNWKLHLKDLINAGAGEIFINSVDKDGTLSGMDFDLIKEASELIEVPLIAAGGVGNLNDIKLGINAGANAIGAGAFFVYYGIHRAVLITYPKYSILENLLK